MIGTTRGGQPRYSTLAIETALTLGLVFGLGQRLEEKHGVGSRHDRRKLHLALDADDPSQAEPLIDQIKMSTGQFTADGAHDGNPTYQVMARHRADAAIVIPPRSNALERPDSHPPSQRDRHRSLQIDHCRLFADAHS